MLKSVCCSVLWFYLSDSMLFSIANTLKSTQSYHPKKLQITVGLQKGTENAAEAICCSALQGH
jgi:hypothetical protein